MSEAYGPSLLHIAMDGTVLMRIVPDGAKADYQGVEYAVAGGLPAILGANLASAAFNCLALSPDEHFLYLAIKGHPPEVVAGETQTRPGAPYARLIKFDLQSLSTVEQYPYRLDPPESFRQDHARRPRSQADVRMAELIALPGGRLMAVERVWKSAHISIVDPAGARLIGPVFDLSDTEPSFEVMSDGQFDETGMEPVAKTMILDTDMMEDTEHAKIPDRIEGVALMSDRQLAIITDNAYGIEGERTRMFRLTFPDAILK